MVDGWVRESDGRLSEREGERASESARYFTADSSLFWAGLVCNFVFALDVIWYTFPAHLLVIGHRQNFTSRRLHMKSLCPLSPVLPSTVRRVHWLPSSAQVDDFSNYQLNFGTYIFINQDFVWKMRPGCAHILSLSSAQQTAETTTKQLKRRRWRGGGGGITSRGFVLRPTTFS